MATNIMQASSITPDRLGQKVLPFGGGTWANCLIYTVPTDGSVSRVIVKAVRFTNLRSSPTTLTWGIAPSGATTEAIEHKFLSGYTIPANDACDESDLYQVLRPGDSVYAYGGAGNGVSATVSGLVIV